MIVLFSFVPLGFGGGAERWMIDVADYITAREEVWIVEVWPWLASWYTRLVLRRNVLVDIPVEIPKGVQRLTLGASTFWQCRQVLSRARVVYCKMEIIDLVLVRMLAGLGIWSRLVVGLQSPLVYFESVTIFQRLHMWVYQSTWFWWWVRGVRRFHVLNDRDEQAVGKHFSGEIARIGNFAAERKLDQKLKNKTGFRVMFAGDLSRRKGVDRLVEVIERLAPLGIEFVIAGTGAMQHEVEELSARNAGVQYLGFLSHDAVLDWMQGSDVLFLPSRAEGMPLVILEALSVGCVIVNSPEAAVGMPEDIEYTGKTTEEFEAILLYLSQTPIDRTFVVKFFVQQYSQRLVLPRLYSSVFA